MKHSSEGKLKKIETQKARAAKAADRKARREARAKAKREQKKG